MSKATIDIHYCQQCNWMLRATWMMQELLHTFSDDINCISLHPATGGKFQIYCNDELIWDRCSDDGFPDAKTLKQRVRDILDSERNLGHIDKKHATH